MYRHTQTGWVIIVSLGGALVFVAGLALLLLAGRPPIPASGVLGGVSAILFVCLVLFGSLTVSVDAEKVEARFGPGAIRVRIPLAEIEACRVVRNEAWMGWGIHYYGRGWLYNVSGMEAVELSLRGGKQCRIGTDEPEALCAAITTHLHPQLTGYSGSRE